MLSSLSERNYAANRGRDEAGSAGRAAGKRARSDKLAGAAAEPEAAESWAVGAGRGGAPAAVGSPLGDLLTSAGEELIEYPHRQAIERSFGRAVPEVAEVGPAAQARCRDLGAVAYAEGGQVGFATRQPDLHTAAHEAAHAVQEREGVACKATHGAGGDGYEVHADRAADRVVRGESAADLFGGQVAPGGRARCKRMGEAKGDETPSMGPIKFPLKEVRLSKDVSISGVLAFKMTGKQGGEVASVAGPQGSMTYRREMKDARNMFQARLAQVRVGDDLSLEGLPDLELDLGASLSLGTSVSAGVTGKLTGDLTEWAVENGWLAPEVPLSIELVGQLRVNVSPADAVKLLQANKARRQMTAHADDLIRYAEEAEDLEPRVKQLRRERDMLVRAGGAADDIAKAERAFGELDGKWRQAKNRLRNAKRAFDGAARRLHGVASKVEGMAGRLAARLIGESATQLIKRIAPVVGPALFVWDVLSAYASIFKKALSGNRGNSTVGEKSDKEGAAGPGGGHEPAGGHEVGNSSEESSPDGDSDAGGDVEGNAIGGSTDDLAEGDAVDGADLSVLHEPARVVYGVIAHSAEPGADVNEERAIDGVWLETLATIVPADLGEDDLAALTAALRGRAGTGGDRDAVLAIVLEEVMRLGAGSVAEPSGDSAQGNEKQHAGEQPSGEHQAEEGSGAETGTGGAASPQPSYILRRLRPRDVVRFEDGRLVLDQDKVDASVAANVRMYAPSGAVATIRSIELVEREQLSSSDLVQFALRIELATDAGNEVVIDEHAVVRSRGEDQAAQFLTRGKDELHEKLLPLLHFPSKPGEKIRVDPGAVHFEDYTLEIKSVSEPYGHLVLGRATLYQFVLHALPKGVQGKPLLIDDSLHVHQIENNELLDMEVRIWR